MAARHAIVVRRDDPAESDTDSQDRKICTGHQFTGDTLGLPAEGEAGVIGEPAEHPAENVIVVAKVRVHGVGDRIAAPIASVVHAAHSEQHQLLRLLHRKHPQ